MNGSGRIYDTTISLTREKPRCREACDKSEDFKKTMQFMGSIGFYVGEDKQIKRDYPILNQYHRYGRYGDLEFKAENYATGYKIEFFQNINYENPNGGYYDVCKKEKMPYLIKKQYELTEKKIIRFLESESIAVKCEQKQKGEAFIIDSYIKSWHHPQKEPFVLSEINGQTAEDYNNKDRNGRKIYNGEIKYFRDWNGYLARGRVYHNINNMWWVLLSCGTVRNIASFELFDIKEEEKHGRVKKHRPPKEYTLRKEQLALCSKKELENELKRRTNNDTKKDIRFKQD